MTGQEFRDYVVRKFIRTDKDTELYEATTDIIADMRLQFLSEDFKEETYSSGISTVGEYKLGLPTDFGHIIGDISVTDTDEDTEYGTLQKISKQRYDELYGDRLLASTTNMDLGIPKHYCIYAKQIFIGPVPDLTTYRYQFNYTTESFTEVTAATDPVPFTDRHRNTVRAGVLAELYDGMENFQEAQYYRSMYIDGLGKLAANDETNTQDDAGVCYRGI